MLNSTGSLSIKTAPVLSRRDGILPDNKEVKKVSGMESRVCLVVDILCPPTLRLITSLVDQELEDEVKTGNELGTSIDLLFEAEDVLRERDLSGDLEITDVPEEVDEVFVLEVVAEDAPLRREVVFSIPGLP
jgi:hypothetical protein